MSWSLEGGERSSLRHSGLAHHVGDALALPQEDWIVTLRATETETLNRERGIKCQPALGCHLRLLQLPQIGQSRSEKEMHEREIGRDRVAEELERRRGTPIAEHLKLVLNVIDRRGP
jgi:hypothetical protein